MTTGTPARPTWPDQRTRLPSALAVPLEAARLPGTRLRADGRVAVKLAAASNAPRLRTLSVKLTTSPAKTWVLSAMATDGERSGTLTRTRVKTSLASPVSSTRVARLTRSAPGGSPVGTVTR